MEQNIESRGEMSPNRHKKFVVVIYPENVDFMEQLSYEEKNDLINELIIEYRTEEKLSKKSYFELEKLRNNMKKTVLIIVAIPLIIALLSVSLYLTKNSYVNMQRNFESLFEKHNAY